MTPWDYLLDHLPGLLGSIGALIVIIRQSYGQNRLFNIEVHIQDVKRDLQGNVGNAIVANVTEQIKPVVREAADEVTKQIKPVMEAAAVVAADKIVAKADEVACALAKKKDETWDGVERRTGVPDRRTGPVDRRTP